MELRHENGTPLKKWIVELPITGVNVMNNPTSTMNVECITLMAKADCSISYSGRNAILTFAKPESGIVRKVNTILINIVFNEKLVSLIISKTSFKLYHRLNNFYNNDRSISKFIYH